MGLRPNAVVLFLHQHSAGTFTENLRRDVRWSGQHEIDCVKQPELYAGQFIAKRSLQRFTNVSQKHIRAAHGKQGPFVSVRDGLFHEALFRADAEIARYYLDDVLDFAAGGFCE